jgi:hypothetical protein
MVTWTAIPPFPFRPAGFSRLTEGGFAPEKAIRIARARVGVVLVPILAERWDEYSEQNPNDKATRWLSVMV